MNLDELLENTPCTNVEIGDTEIKYYSTMLVKKIITEALQKQRESDAKIVADHGLESIHAKLLVKKILNNKSVEEG